MSRRNIVNPDHYKTAGRLTPDEWARERRKQAEPLSSAPRRGRRAPVPPWMAPEAGQAAAPGARRTSAKTGGRNPEEKKSGRRTPEARTQETPKDSPRGARSSAAKARTTPKTSAARGTPNTGSAPKARGSAARGASPQRARRPGAYRTTPAGTGKRKSAKR